MNECVLPNEEIWSFSVFIVFSPGLAFTGIGYQDPGGGG